MRDRFCSVLGLVLLLGFCAHAPVALSASLDLAKAKKAAEANGFIFEESHDAIVEKARAEGKLRVLSSTSPGSVRQMKALVTKKYPFLDVDVQELTGPEAYQRSLLELKAGTATWDTIAATPDMYNEFTPERKKFDILGMAEHGVLDIPREMVDPKNRGVVAVGSGLCSAAYNKNRIAPEKVPNSWEDFLRPDLKGKFIVEIRATCLAGLTAGLGESWIKDYAKKIAAQDPIWARGATVAMARIIAGEYAMHHMHNYHSCVRAAEKDPSRSLVCKLIQPVPVRLFDPEFVGRTAPHPYAALLWIETEASNGGQAIFDEHEPLGSSIYGRGKVAEAVRGLKVIVNGMQTLQNTTRWQKMVVEAYGFPTAKLGN